MRNLLLVFLLGGVVVAFDFCPHYNQVSKERAEFKKAVRTAVAGNWTRLEGAEEIIRTKILEAAQSRGIPLDPSALKVEHRIYPAGENYYRAGASARLEYERDVGFYYSRRVTIAESKSSFDTQWRVTGGH